MPSYTPVLNILRPVRSLFVRGRVLDDALLTLEQAITDAGVTQEQVDAAVAAVVAGAPGALNTLDELAAALGDDANFAATVTTSLAGKVAKSTYDANSILKADTDDTPIALTVGASQVVGRKASGSIVAMTMAELRAILAGTDDTAPAQRVTGVNSLSARNFVGRKTTVGAPGSGTWVVDDEVMDSAGVIWRCTAGGTPGTWASVSGTPLWTAAIAPWGTAVANTNWSTVQQQSSNFNGYRRISSGADGASCEWDVGLEAGTYTLDVACEKNTDRGIVVVTIDGVTVATLDQYATSTQVVMSTAGIVIATTGKKRVKFTATGRNGSSGGNYVTLSGVSFTRTA